MEEDKREEDYSPAQGSEDQQMSPEVSALSRTPTPASLCPVSSPLQRPIRIRQQHSHRKFLLAIPAITVLAVAAVVLFYAITWNDSPPATGRNDVIKIPNEEATKRASGRMAGIGDDDSEQGPSQGARTPKRKNTNLNKLPEKDDSDEDSESNDNSLPGLGLREMGPGFGHAISITKKEPITTTEKGDDHLFDSVPWPSYGDLNFTDEDLYSEEMLYKVDKLVNRKKMRHPFYIDLVESKRNFTDANAYCKSRNGYLMQLFNVQEELYFSRILAHSELFHSKCDNGLLGFRRILQKDVRFKGIKGSIFADALASVSDILVKSETEESNEGDCVALYYNATMNIFGLIRKPCNSSLNCYLCESAQGCSAASCYFWHYKMNQTVTYEQAKKLCFSEKEGTLARIQNRVTLDKLKILLNLSKTNSIFNLYSESACSQGYYVEKVGTSKSQLAYENADEQQITYKSPSIMLLSQDTFDDNRCLSVSKDRGFRWMPVRCTEKRCFFCRYDRL